MYIVGPSKIGKTDTCYNLLNKDGKHCKVFVIDTYTNCKSFHDYLKENGLPDFVLVDDISIEELGREWKNFLGGQNTITYAISSTNKVTINYSRPCICLCNPDAHDHRSEISPHPRNLPIPKGSSIVSQSFYYKPKDVAKAADAYVRWYKSTH